MNGGVPTARDHLVVDKYDAEEQEALLEEGLKDPSRDREAFDNFLEVFPTAGLVWNRYVQRELEKRQYEYVDSLFKKCLTSSVNVELWMTYLKYVIESTMSSKMGPMDRKSKIRECFEFTLSHIGLDMGANVVWEEYISWLKKEVYDHGFVCDIYVRALSNPMHKLDQLWRDYEKFTEKMQRLNANEVSARYATAKRVYDERLKHTEGLTKNALARPPRNNITDLHQAKLWKQLIEYEKSNPQDLEAAKLSERISFTFNQALVTLYHYPEMWHQSALYQLEIGNVEMAKRTYASGISVLKDCLLIHFQFCDFLELHNFTAEADAIYKRLTQQFAQNPLVWIQYMYFARRVHGIQAGRKLFFKARKQQTATFHLYVAAAQLEFYVNKDDNVARNIFELGYHQFENNPVFLKHYVDFLYHRSEDSHMRVLFEKIISHLPNTQALELWNQFLQFETACGNLEPAYKLQERRASAFPGMDPSGILAAVQRYRFLDLWPCSTAELASFENDYSLEADNEDENEQEAAATDNAAPAQRRELVMPDIKQLQLYKGTGAPGQVATSSTLSIKLDELMIKLPSARDWVGPSVNIELLMQSILNFVEMPAIAGPARYTASRADEEDDSGMQARARESALANDQFRKRVNKVHGSAH